MLFGDKTANAVQPERQMPLPASAVPSSAVHSTVERQFQSDSHELQSFGLFQSGDNGVASRQPTANAKPQRILFYHHFNPHYGFTNFSPNAVDYDGKYYPTSEHLFQSMKFQGHRPDLAEYIRTFSDEPSQIFAAAQRLRRFVRADWADVSIEKMEEALWHKFTQHEDLKNELLGTHDAELVEDSPSDSFWGVGADGRGQNQLGKSLMKIRTQLREQVMEYQVLQRNKSTTPSPMDVDVVQPTVPAIAPPESLCEHCHMRRKHGTHRYCGKTCAREANKALAKKTSENIFGEEDLGIHVYLSSTSRGAKPRGDKHNSKKSSQPDPVSPRLGGSPTQSPTTRPGTAIPEERQDRIQDASPRSPPQAPLHVNIPDKTKPKASGQGSRKLTKRPPPSHTKPASKTPDGFDPLSQDLLDAPIPEDKPGSSSAFRSQPLTGDNETASLSSDDQVYYTALDRGDINSA